MKSLGSSLLRFAWILSWEASVPRQWCAFSSLLDSYLLWLFTWDSRVKHGLPPLCSRLATHAAYQLTHIRANKHEALGSSVHEAERVWGVAGVKKKYDVWAGVSLPSHEHVITNSDMTPRAKALDMYNITATPETPPAITEIHQYTQSKKKSSKLLRFKF